jgi:hypothetical protein
LPAAALLCKAKLGGYLRASLGRPDGGRGGEQALETASDLVVWLSVASVKKAWDVYSAFDWPAALDPAHWCMPPELVSLYGTSAWDALDEAGQRRLSLYEVANFFSLTLHGERPLVQGLCNQMYSRQNEPVTEYIHHFLDEENRHMVMFAMFCKRYAGKVYPMKKIAFPKKYAKGEEDVTFFIKALIIEEIGDYYNVAMSHDARLAPIVQEVNRFHHRDEARHIVFGRRILKETFDESAPGWPAETLARVRSWLGDYLRSSWLDFYNPTVYRDAGVPDPYGAREAALASDACRSHRERASAGLLGYFLETGILTEVPAL